MHKLKAKIRHFIFFSLFIIFAHSAFADNGNNRNLTLFAEQNMVKALTQIVTLYSSRNKVTVLINFNSSSELVNEIDLGEPADVFITGHLGLINTLKQKGLVDVYNIDNFAQDKLKLVTSKDNPDIDIKLFKEGMTLEDALKQLDLNKSPLIIDQEENTSGLIGNKLIKSLDLNNIKLFQKLPEDKTSIFNIVYNDPRNYALLLSSQIEKQDNLLVIAEEKDANIFYKSLVIAGNNMETSRDFLLFLQTDEVKKILEENNFIVK